MNQPHDPAASQSLENVDSVQWNVQTVVDVGSRSNKNNRTFEISHNDTDDGKENDDNLDNKRGWLMAVATLFIGMTFQAGLQTPAWFPDDWHQAFRQPNPDSHHAATTTTLTKGQIEGVWRYIMVNTTTFTLAMALLITTLLMKAPSANITMQIVRAVSGALAFGTCVTFVLGSSNDWIVIRSLLSIMFGGLGGYIIFLCTVMIMAHRRRMSATTTTTITAPPPPGPPAAAARRNGI